ncbi:hypothetical protein J7T55_001543 [Diaporthe amygdali]|uniref:uncharacterized protein n=1 Tax=Phomopsis amygdali TaxID=1214568 RepID=UPI0022FED44A|nr:uncharacterized protein J7T55_001543 [Diaporthe amygdali]KAJ0115134.1 hypothetical protein J7T55_001543 [Diaporthe amygdali]
MESRVRWHRSNCDKPNIIVNDGEPHCHSCDSNSSVLVARLVAENQAIGGVISLPVEAPLGEADFWWPPSVPYSSPRVDTRTNSEPCNDAKEAQILSPKDTQLSSVSTIYSSSLDSSRLRLIYLTESEDASSPIHIQLEEYALNDSPEYETVSYVWGGENGDSTACKPIYVGPSWDMILVTNNCSALLHYLRPRKGSRVIWLDAICINQANNVEKSAQISIMRDIYVNCQRVVVYFGGDLIQQLSGRLFRPRIDFAKTVVANESRSTTEKSAGFFMACAKSAGISQDQLFERRYLTRIWIVQELVLSSKAVFPLGDSDILCDGDVAAHLVLRPKGQQLASSAVRGSMSNLLKATSHCDASDPRDKIYGLLGLFRPQDVSCSLISDYTLSWRDCWVGIGGYIVLVEKNITLLVHAVGTYCLFQLPSWVPDIRTAGSWLLDLPTKPPYQKSRVSEDAAETWAIEFVMYSKGEQDWMHYDLFPSKSWGLASHLSVGLPSDVLCSMSLDQVSVNSSNGGLQLQALRVFDHPCRLTTMNEGNGYSSIWFRGPSTAAGFRILGLNHSLDHDKSYHVFIISDQPQLSGYILLAITTALPGEDSSVVTLHGCCIIYDIRFYSMDHLETNRESIPGLHWLLEKFQPVLIESHQWKSQGNWVFRCFFPCDDATSRDFLRLLIRATGPPLIQIFEEGKPSSQFMPPTLVESISWTAERLCPDFDPLIWGDYYHFTIKNKKMFSMWKAYRGLSSSYEEDTITVRRVSYELEADFSDPFIHDKARWTRIQTIFDKEGSDGSGYGLTFPFTVRIPLETLVACVRKSELCMSLCTARGYNSNLNEDLDNLLGRKSTLKDRDILLQDWDKGFIQDLGLAWKSEKIIIV